MHLYVSLAQRYQRKVVDVSEGSRYQGHAQPTLTDFLVHTRTQGS